MIIKGLKDWYRQRKWRREYAENVRALEFWSYRQVEPNELKEGDEVVFYEGLTSFFIELGMMTQSRLQAGFMTHMLGEKEYVSIW